MNFKNLIFPQITPNKKQKKELPYIYCYNIRIVDYRQVDDNEFKNYFNYMIKHHSDKLIIRNLNWSNISAYSFKTNIYNNYDYVSICSWMG